MIIQVLGGRSALETFAGHVVAKISQCQGVILPPGNIFQARGDPRNLGDDVGDTGKLSTLNEKRKEGGKKTYITPLSTMSLRFWVSPSRKSSKPPPNLLKEWRQGTGMSGKGRGRALTPYHQGNRIWNDRRR